jgi:hypothetical protein
MTTHSTHTTQTRVPTKCVVRPGESREAQSGGPNRVGSGMRPSRGSSSANVPASSGLPPLFSPGFMEVV